MQISSRFTIATHILIAIALKKDEEKATSDFLAKSIGVNPVIIRKILLRLKSAGLISVARGTGGASITKELKTIHLLDVYQAVECLGKSGKLFSFHENPNPTCPVGKNIHSVLDCQLEAIQMAMEKELAQSNLDDIVTAIQGKIENK